MNIAINGFGRMGRLGLRAGWDSDTYQVTRVNELHGDAKTAAHLLEFDSVHGRWDRQIGYKTDQITIENKEIHYSCLLYTSPSPRDLSTSRMPSSA